MADNVAVTLFLPATIAMINLALGLGLTRDDFTRVGNHPRAVGLGLGLQLVGLPVLGALCAAAFGLGPELAVGMVLITACPGGAHSNLFANLARADTALSISLTALSGVITVATIPLWMWSASMLFGAGEVVQLPLLQTTGQIVGVVLVPLGLGMMVRARSARWAAWLERWVKALAVVLLLVIVVGAVARQADQVARFAREVGPSVVTLHGVALVGGFAAARLAGLGRAQQVAISLEVGVQNSALAVGIALSLLGSTSIAVPAIVYSLLVYATSAALVVWSRLHYLKPTGPA